MNSLPEDAAAALTAMGYTVLDAQPVAGGDICEAWRVRCEDQTLFCKTTNTQHDQMFEIEAAGLQWLSDNGGSTPQVVSADRDHLILQWLPQTAPTTEAAQEFGRQLARLHSQPAPSYGCPPPGVMARAGYIGSAPMMFGTWDRVGDYLVQGRILPMAELAYARGGLRAAQLADLERLAGDLPTSRLVADAGPRVVHGDLWSGNVLWLTRGAALIDPAAHGGHPEEDLAMLQLFGVPKWQQLLAGYQEVAPLAADWQDRVGLFQLYPLLVHAALFGGHYGDSATRTAKRYL